MPIICTWTLFHRSTRGLIGGLVIHVVIRQVQPGRQLNVRVIARADLSVRCERFRGNDAPGPHLEREQPDFMIETEAKVGKQLTLKDFFP